ncbi:MAG: tRNA-intron lyase [Candidatus Bathyarchaeota archaeon]|nr:tRNA-intron lyase [Candidatus Bathyarchaeota archaeon]
MSDKEGSQAVGVEIKVKGSLVERGVQVSEQSSVDALSQRGYGVAEEEGFRLTFYEALFLADKQMLSVKNGKGAPVTFQDLLKAYEKTDENAWGHYLVYRDLRSRGYVVREGFGEAIEFRIYDRGAYGKDTATSLVISTQEGKPMPMEHLATALSRCQSLKKELVVAVTNRRGEIVYYSVSSLTFK